jgi:hypothetical protein
MSETIKTPGNKIDSASSNPAYGLMAEFETEEALVEAVRRVRAEGYRRIDAYSPFPIEGLTELLGIRPTVLPYVVFISGVIGALAGWGLQYFALVINYPYNVGGRPLNSWPAMIPITFETTILFAGIAAFICIIVMNGLPEPYHPVFNVSGFERASVDRFFLVIENRDPRFNASATSNFLQSLKPTSVSVIES